MKLTPEIVRLIKEAYIEGWKQGNLCDPLDYHTVSDPEAVYLNAEDDWWQSDMNKRLAEMLNLT